MLLKLILHDDVGKIDKQITALKAIIPKDNFKDRNIHIRALRKLQEHRKQIVKGSKIND